MKKFVIAILAIAAFLIACVLIGTEMHKRYLEEQEILLIEQQEFFQQELDKTMIPKEWYVQDGHDNVKDWWNNLVEKKNESSNIASEITEEIGNYLTEEQTNRLMEISNNIQESHLISEIEAYRQEAYGIAEAAKAEKKHQEAAAKAQKSAHWFKSAGVVHANGYKYTYYSTSEGSAGVVVGIPGRHTDDRGFICDKDGYISVASSVHPRGTVVPTPFGDGKVYDSGCAANVIDLYTNW